MTDILDELHARCAEAAGEAILSGEQHPRLTLTTREVADLLNHIDELRRRCEENDLEYRELEFRHGALRQAVEDAGAAFGRIRVALEQRTAHPEANVRQARTIARVAAQQLALAGAETEDAAG
ncbi:hypothetical protein [Nocardia huaxiensis]|uniref:Uncharacterized protein n=1 Tax=Nocardia huaxiensis TaxID=2755382 RepID=A0A7D6Z1U1_9NOCA|nr:hypothetical protein [Nocardia huaxiensis]QLY28644.1 hypothetical protein H0264_25310 [Nocardia huaxiensis]UFS97884.1 hypothetical protein LPY97_08285 [Nocardia huaxiensis]